MRRRNLRDLADGLGENGSERHMQAMAAARQQRGKVWAGAGDIRLSVCGSLSFFTGICSAVKTK